MSDASAFSPDYVTARARFRAAAHGLGCHIEAHSIGQKGPNGETLTIDVARIGSSHPDRVVVVSSGLHGVEGFLGSAVQCAMLEDHLGGWVPQGEGALIFVHGLNPYGFAWLRRVNEDNTDLNRNFLKDGEVFKGSPEKYGDLNGLLNRATPPGVLDGFWLRSVWQIARHGFAALKSAIAGGQYDYPHGLFFGGHGPSRTQEILKEALPRWCGTASRVVHVDFHTGLGKPGTYKLITDRVQDSPEFDALTWMFGEGVVEGWSAEGGVAYPIRGGLGSWCRDQLKESSYELVAAEFGTVHVLSVIKALQAENRAHHYCPPVSITARRTKEQLRDVFAPRQRAWRDEVVPLGLKIVHQAIEGCFDPSSRPELV